MMNRTLSGRLTVAIEKTTPAQNFVGVASAAQAMPSQTIASSSVPRRNWKRGRTGAMVEEADMARTAARRHRGKAWRRQNYPTPLRASVPLCLCERFFAAIVAVRRVHLSRRLHTLRLFRLFLAAGSEEEASEDAAEEA